MDLRWGIEALARLFWPGNSPDLNMIEPAWPYLKRRTTARGPSTTGKDARNRWKAEWRALPMTEIRRWIERIPQAIEKIIAACISRACISWGIHLIYESFLRAGHG